MFCSCIEASVKRENAVADGIDYIKQLRKLGYGYLKNMKLARRAVSDKQNSHMISAINMARDRLNNLGIETGETCFFYSRDKKTCKLLSIIINDKDEEVGYYWISVTDEGSYLTIWRFEEYL